MKKFRTLQRRSNISVDKILRGIVAAQRVGFEHIKLNFVFFNEASRNDLAELIRYVSGKDLTLVLLPVIEAGSHYTLSDLYELLKVYDIEDEETITDREGIQKRLIRLKGDSKVLLRLDELADKKPYTFCRVCVAKKQCREGIFPIRLSANGELIPCLASSAHRISIRNQLAARDMTALQVAFNTIRGWYERFNRNPRLKQIDSERQLFYAHRSNHAAEHIDWNADIILGDRSLITSYVCRWSDMRLTDSKTFNGTS